MERNKELNTIDYQAFAAYLKTCRKKRGFSREKVAEAVDITPHHLVLIENGHRKPSVQVLFGLAKLLNLSLDEFLQTHRDAEPDNDLDRILLRRFVEGCSKQELQAVHIFINQILVPLRDQQSR